MSSFPFDEATTNQYHSLAEAHRAALQPLAAAIARAVRAGLQDGRFVVRNGLVVPAKPHTIPIEETCEMPASPR